MHHMYDITVNALDIYMQLNRYVLYNGVYKVTIANTVFSLVLHIQKYLNIQMCIH